MPATTGSSFAAKPLTWFICTSTMTRSKSVMPHISRGKAATETGDLLKKELQDQKVQVAAIGLAGENRVYMASIDHNHASAARGVGVIMGDKRLKAIAVRGTKDVHIARPAEMFEMAPSIHKKMAASTGCGDWMAIEEDDSFHHNHFAWGNARTRRRITGARKSRRNGRSGNMTTWTGRPVAITVRSHAAM